MQFITAEQFLKTDTKVQQAIIDWWKPSVGDLVYDKDNIIDVVVPNLCIGDYKDNLDKNTVIPLLTEGQLREFIENKTMYSVVPELHVYNSPLINDTYFINLFDTEVYWVKTTYEIETNDLLQALWQIACKIVLSIN